MFTTFKHTLLAALALFTTLASTAPLPLPVPGPHAPRVHQQGLHRGDGTYFPPGLGACGHHNVESDFIVSIAAPFFNSFGPQSNGNPICGRKIRATYHGKSVIMKIEDKCPGCLGPFDLDMSPAGFKALANPKVGRLHGVQWELI